MLRERNQKDSLKIGGADQRRLERMHHQRKLNSLLRWTLAIYLVTLVISLATVCLLLLAQKRDEPNGKASDREDQRQDAKGHNPPGQAQVPGPVTPLDFIHECGAMVGIHTEAVQPVNEFAIGEPGGEETILGVGAHVGESAGVAR